MVTDPHTGSRPGGLTRDLTLRFFTLILLILGSTASIYSHLWILTRPGGELAGRTCFTSMQLQQMYRINPATADQVARSALYAVTCARPYTADMVWASLGGVVLVVAAGLGLYRLLPWWKTRYANSAYRIVRSRLTPGRSLGRFGLVPLSRYPTGAGVDLDLLDELTTHMGERPRLLFYVATFAHEPVAYGTGREPRIVLSTGLLALSRTDPARFTAILLHELAHVRNRDNLPTYLTVAIWRAFVWLAAVPYLVVLLLPQASSPVLPGQSTSLASRVQPIVVVLVLTLLVRLARTWVLRARELNADATAAAHDRWGALRWYFRVDDPAAAGPVDERRRRWVPGFLRSHPPFHVRREAMAGRGRARPFVAEFFVAGVGLSVLSTDLTLLTWYALVASGTPITVDAALPLAVLVAGANVVPVGVLAWLATAVLWRARVAGSDIGVGRAGRLVPVPLRLASAATVGIVLGEPLSVSFANGGTWGILGRPAPAAMIAAVVFLVLTLSALFSWSSANAAAWLAVLRGSPRWACILSAVVGGLALLPIYIEWWFLHGQDQLFTVYLWTPQTARFYGDVFWPAPAIGWLHAMFTPVDLPGAVPGVAVLLTLPCVLTSVALLRRPPSAWLAAGPRVPSAQPRLGRAVGYGALGGLVAIGAGLGFDAWIRSRLGPASLLTLRGGATLEYLDQVYIDLTAVTAAVVAATVLLLPRTRSGTLGFLAAAVTAHVAALAAPIVVLTGACGPSLVPTCWRNAPTIYPVTFGFTDPRAAVRAAFAALLAIAVAAVVARMLRLRPSHQPLHRRPRRGAPIVATALLALLCVDLVAGAWYGYRLVALVS